jgi:hypothetical protein
MREHEVHIPGELLDPAGRLCEPGWSRQPLQAFDPRRVGGRVFRQLRLKQWDYYGIFADDFYASVGIAHAGFVGMGFLYVVDPALARNPERTVVRPLGAGIVMPRDSSRGAVAFVGGGLALEFSVAAGGERRLRARDPRFDGGAGLEIEADLACPPQHESLVMATPFPQGGFFYNRKVNVLPATGFVRWGARRVELAPDRALGLLDWGRGVWPYRTHWVWANANGFSGDGRRLGLNLGFVRGEGAAAENAVIVDGRVHKIGWVDAAFDPRDYRKPWRFRDREGRLDVELVPSFERVTRSEALVLRTEVHQCFGRWSGRAVLDDGSELRIAALPGFAEEHHARW